MGGTGITVDTANSLQGREFDGTIVLASLHRHVGLVVAWAGIPELLDAHPSTEPVHLNVPVKFPTGWEANQAMLAHLSQWKVRAR